MGFRFRIRRLASFIALIVIVVAITSCSSMAERRAVCDRAAGLDNELSVISRIVDDISNISPEQLANTFSVTIGSLSTMYDLGPSSLRSDFGLLLGVYQNLGNAIEATGWNGPVAATDRIVLAARASLSANPVIEARDAIRLYVIDNCLTEFDINGDPFEGSPTTLPDPAIQDENAPDPLTGFDNDDSISASYGYFVAEQYNLAITNEQAICIGKLFVEQAIVDPLAADDAYTEFVSATLATCGVEADISGS